MCVCKRAGGCADACVAGCGRRHLPCEALCDGPVRAGCEALEGGGAMRLVRPQVTITCAL